MKSFLKGMARFIIFFYLITILCEVIWEVFVDGNIYDCTDPLFGYLTPDGWVGGNNWPVISVKHIVSGRPMGDPDAIKEGWSVAGLWCIWAALFVSSLMASFILAATCRASSLKWLGDPVRR